MEYFVYETGASKTIYSKSFNEILNYFDDRRNADDRGNYVSLGVMINENSCFDRISVITKKFVLLYLMQICFNSLELMFNEIKSAITKLGFDNFNWLNKSAFSPHTLGTNSKPFNSPTRSSKATLLK